MGQLARSLHCIEHVGAAAPDECIAEAGNAAQLIDTLRQPPRDLHERFVAHHPKGCDIAFRGRGFPPGVQLP